MTREEAEKLRQARRKKRLRKKRIKAFAMLAVCIAVVVLAVVFAVKGITYLLGRGESSMADSGISGGEVLNSGEEISSDGENSTAESESSTENTASDSESSSADVSSGSESTTTPAGEKPQQTWSTMLVNIWTPMPEGYVPEVRRVYNCGADTGKDFDVRAADALEQMLTDARAAGYNMYLVSAYRTYDYQVGLYSRKVNEYLNLGYDQQAAETEAAKWVAVPGTSEHCIGLAADIVSSTWYNDNDDLTYDFENTEHFDWLYEHCADYGFILRFPKNREATTGITYEPWHYRYVGVEAAKYIMANNITLEEFHAQ